MSTISSTLATYLIITLIVLATLFIKREEWFGRKLRRHITGRRRGQKLEEISDSIQETPAKKRRWYSTDWWHPNAKILSATIGTLVIVNFMVKLMTTAWPEIWDWYFTNNLAFFIAFNAAWVAYAFYAYQEDEDGKPVPAMMQRARIIRVFIIILALINLGGSMRGNVPVKKALEKEPVLAAIASCRPEEEFNTPDKVQVAKARYQLEGVESWLPSSKCWSQKIPRGTVFTLAIVTVKKGEAWSRKIIPIASMQNYEVNTSCPPEDQYQTRINGNDNMIVAKDERVETIIYSLEFREEKKDVVVTVIMRPSTS